MMKIGRREAAKRALLVLGAGAVAPSLLAGCGGEEEAGGLSCNQTGGLNATQLAQRTTQEYVEHSTTPNEKCENCRFFTAGAPDGCGTCTVVPGPIHPDGHSKLWAALSA
jgi:hypothetical protein